MNNACKLHIYYIGQDGEVAYLTIDMDRKNKQKKEEEEKGLQYINKLDTTRLNHTVYNQGEN